MTPDRQHPPDRPVFQLTLRAEPHVVDATRALRRALKFCLRACGLRCVDAVEVRHDTAKAAEESKSLNASAGGSR
jgi:hypothetical protein